MSETPTNNANPVETGEPDAFHFSVLSALMNTGKTVDHASSLVVGISLIAAWSSGLSHVTMQAMLLAIVGLALAGKYYSWRVRLDAHLFAILAGAPERATSLDALLAWCLHLSPTTASRPLASKWRGARRLLIRQALVLALQVLVVVASAVIAGWGNS